VIQSFAYRGLFEFFFYETVPKKVGWANVRKIVRRKLAAVDSATSLSDLKSPPGNNLELLKDDLANYWSIRVNDQWRVIFKWPKGAPGPIDVDVVDYHRG
jgi:proteic killer suppression protein